MYSPVEFGKMINKPARTLRRWDDQGLFPALRDEKNRRYYTSQHYHDFFTAHPKGVGKVIAYLRVRNRKEKGDLLIQRAILEKFCASKAYVVDEWIEDIGEAHNLERRKFCRLMELVELGKVDKIIVVHRDRIIRHKFEWFDHMMVKHRTKLVVSPLPYVSQEAEVMKDILQLHRMFPMENHI